MAAGERSTVEAERALEELCSTYWYPLYAYARRWGASRDDAADLTQEFFARLLEKQYLLAADRQKGRFRSFLLTVFKRFLSKERDRAAAQKRGGDRRQFSFDVEAGERRYLHEPAENVTPEALYERRWALTLLERVMERVRDEYASKDKRPFFEQCKPFLTGSDHAATYAEIAPRLDMTESALRVAVHRLRERYRVVLRSEIAQTISDSDSVEDELNALRAALRGTKS
ncbi:RNA polymerase sigma factor [Maioricimonas rarisocia]|uniref:RNA polymerase sigma factor n=1 Tax=Maioricimonas rarisocia TaxID=2528026 RepID=UPI001E3C9CEF|nr:sigma factor [Maioricimonas rarisocia]